MRFHKYSIGKWDNLFEYYGHSIDLYKSFLPSLNYTNFQFKFEKLGFLSDWVSLVGVSSAPFKSQRIAKVCLGNAACISYSHISTKFIGRLQHSVTFPRHLNIWNAPSHFYIVLATLLWSYFLYVMWLPKWKIRSHSTTFYSLNFTCFENVYEHILK